MRLFFGFPWPGPAAEDLALRAKVWHGRPGLRMVSPENWHVTLRFLGEVDEAQTGVLAELLGGWSKAKGPLTFVDRGWGCFGSPKSPRVVVLRLEAMPPVQKTIDSFHKVLDQAGFPGDGKAWKPHVTLAYGKGADPGPWPAEIPGGRAPVLVDRVVLYESELTPHGSRYREVAAVSLNGHGVSPSL